MRFPIPALALLAGIASPAAAELSAPEQVMMTTVEGGFERDAEFLTRIASVNSGTLNFDGVRQVAEMVAPEFEALGFTTEWIDQSAAGRAGHLFARHKGKAGTTRMLLIAHLDTVFEQDSPFQSVTREGNILTGPGVEDDKGGIVVILAALRAMKAAGTLDDANIVVAMTGDEESAGNPIATARADLVAAAKEADVALDFESLNIEDGVDMGSIARRSSNSWTVTATGKEGHSSQIFTDGAGFGAIYELARILDTFRRELREEDLTYNVGLIAGGARASVTDNNSAARANGKSNIIAPVAVANGDLRTLTPEQTDRVVAKMQAIVADHLPGTGATIEFDFRYPPMGPTDGNRALLDRLNAINADMGLPEMPILPPAKRGAGDVNFVASHVDGLIGFGPSGSGSHAPGETVDLTTFTRQAQRAAIMMSRLAEDVYCRPED
ncbi:M20/M25/M40 family metallo-hydrolase [Qipengyuania soli]|uniref:M20/M25/M40 family metallo-hydrolase n=1 Tax=Qipengyuania soli TaxID=2782568 RepID=A0A7S8IVH5_9SPHN|nr:M20/M25/M40 family metallo-hydrolase [Qipengyuania soli]QPD00190.1 M20/M25/M40 family metallo-hydrolase [Qipengyuania soli]